MMKVFVNDVERIFDTPTLTISQILERINISAVGVVAELDGRIVSNAELSSTTVTDGSRIELIRIVGGG